ncbi:MAG: glycosyltransferase family 39 protein [Anaerolineae bacterium]|nr:glycosyltransferase family 39 protein [Anaerolineae bacterium]
MRYWPFVVCLLLFLALAVPQLSLPGLHYDEAKEAGLNAMQLLTGQPITAFRDATIGIGRWRLPLMVQDYIGALNVILALPFLALGGLNVPALRALPIALAALTLVITGKVAWRLGGPVAGLIAMALLAVNPTFVFWSRQGIFVTNLTALLFMASLWTAWRWWQTRRPADLWWTAFLWGLGLYAKLLFVWAIGALTAVMVVAWGWQRKAGPSPGHPPFPPERTAWRVGLIALGCFVLPLVPLIVFNLQTGGTLISIFSNLGQSYYGVNNRAYWPNLLTRLGQLATLLRGDHLWYLGEVYANRWAPWLAAASAGSAAVLWAWAHKTPRPRAADRGLAFLPFALLGLIVAQSAFTVSDLFITHYALIVPLVPLGVGLTVGELWAWGGRRPRIDHAYTNTATGPSCLREIVRGRWFSAPGARRHLGVRAALGLLVAAALFLWAATDLTNTLRYHRILAVSGGYASHSDAIYHLADFLKEREPSAPLALDWGIDAPVRFLTAGRVNPVEVFGYERLDGPDAGFAGRVAPFLDNPNNLSVAHAGEFTIFRGRAEALTALAAGRGQRLVVAARFGERSGRPLFVVYQTAR